MSENIKLTTTNNPVNGTITVPGDKSISHRAVMFGSIAEGVTTVKGFLEGEDNIATINAFKSMGVDITQDGDTVTVQGVGLKGLKEPNEDIDAGNSGTTTRLLMGLLAGQPFISTIKGDASLTKRPMKRVIEPLTTMGAKIYSSDGSNDNTLPLTIEGRNLKSIEFRSNIASAQLKSAILLATLYTEGKTFFAEPSKSRDHTERMLSAFGVKVNIEGLIVSMEGGQTLKAIDIKVPGDISSAAFFLTAGAIIKDSDITIKDVGVNPTRTGIIDVLKRMGADIAISNESLVGGEPIADINIKYNGPLKAIEMDKDDLVPAIDEFPLICLLCAFADGVSEIRGAEELRVKESDRVALMAKMLDDSGVNAVEHKDGITITGLKSKEAKGGFTVDPEGDHRIAMAAAIMALNSKKEIELTDKDCIAVSMPNFFDLLDEVL